MTKIGNNYIERENLKADPFGIMYSPLQMSMILCGNQNCEIIEARQTYIKAKHFVCFEGLLRYFR